jgi:penicillin-binding protein 1C
MTIRLSALLILLLGPSTAQAVPSFEEVKAAYRSTDAVLVDRHGDLLAQRRISPHGRRLPWVALDRISPAVVPTLLFAEDRRFFHHQGVDWRALAGSAVSSLSGHAPRGASTLTMQLASLIDPTTLHPSGERRSLRQKWDQMRAAQAIESTWGKRAILEAYLNLVIFRGEWQGVEAAARGLFGKAPHGLTQDDAVILISLLPAPQAGPEAVTARACRLASGLGLTTSCPALRASVSAALNRRQPLAAVAALAPHVAARLLTGTASSASVGRRVSSTLDAGLQRTATEALRAQLEGLEDRHVTDGAVLVVDNHSGQVLAYVGSSGGRSPAPFVDGVRAPRQAGSTLKPFLYALAFERKVLTPASLLEDSPLDVPFANGVYRPKNYDSRFHGPVVVREALAASLNVPAVRTLGLVGAESFVERLNALGFEHIREDGDFYGPALALGSAEVTLWELVRAYRILATNGRRQDLHLTPSDSTQTGPVVLSPDAAYLVSEILSDREARSSTFGLESTLATRYWSAVKTGTSTDMRDNWCIGYSDRYTVGVWVGNFSGEPMWSVSGMSGAAPVWIEIMNRLHDGKPEQAVIPPSGVVTAPASQLTQGTARAEWFLRGTEPPRLSPVPAAGQPLIRYPAPDTVMVVDPDIPTDRQRLFFEASGWTANLRWTVDGMPLAEIGALVPWRPRAGRHRVALHDPDGRVLDATLFLVKGGSSRTPMEQERSGDR